MKVEPVIWTSEGGGGGREGGGVSEKRTGEGKTNKGGGSNGR